MPQQSVTSPIGFPFVVLESVDSTNNYAMAQAQQGLAQHGAAYFAKEQTAGKGQRGRAWVTAKGSNIILSILVDPKPLLPVQQFQLSAMTALATQQFFIQYAGDETKIKWPNDIYWRDRKAAGILIENIISQNDTGKTGNSTWQWAVLGIGININQVGFPDELKNPVSLKQITGKTYDVVNLAKELCGFVTKEFEKLNTEGFEEMLKGYNAALYKRGESVRFKKDNRVFSAVIKSVNANGELIIEHSIEEAISFGQIEFE